MSWSRRPARSQRTPHPDPARELELRRILDLRASIARREDLIAQYLCDIGRLNIAIRNDSSTKRIELFRAEVTVMHDRINAAEDAIEKTGGQIADLQAAIPPDDLAYLWDAR